MHETNNTQPLIVTSKEGYDIDLGPLVEAVTESRRNALCDQERMSATGASNLVLGSFCLGIQVAVAKLFGAEAEEAFNARINSPQSSKI